MPKSAKELLAFPSQEPMKAFVPMIFAALSAASTAQGITYEAWQASFFTAGEAANPLVGGDLADPDQDGFNNLLEYALKGDPKTANTALMPTASKAANEAGALHYTRRREALDLDYIVEVSNDLVSWHSGFANVWTTDAVPSATETANGVALVIADQVTATSQLAASGKQFMRLKVIRSPRAGIKAAITADGNNPTAMLTGCAIPQGSYTGYLSNYIFDPVVSNRLGNAPANWYLANVALYHFVETQPTLVKAHINRYLAYKLTDGTHRIKDPDIYSDNTAYAENFWKLFMDVNADSDDAYAGTVLRLAAKYHRLNPSDPWFSDNKQAFKDIAYYNIVTQTKSRDEDKVFIKATDAEKTFNGLVRNYQLVSSSANVGYLMDNVQAWAGLNEFADALEMVEGNSADVVYFRAWRDSILAAIHRILWDDVNQAWRADDTAPYDEDANKYVLQSAKGSPFYAYVHCQLFPELHGLPDVNGNTQETQRKYNMAWKWVITHMPNWTLDASWPLADQFSHLEIAVIAAKHGEKQKVEDFLTMARGRWLPGGTVTRGTVLEQIGYWQLLVGH